MTKQTKWGIALGTIIVIGAVGATVAVVLTEHKNKQKQEDKPIVKVSEPKKEVVLPIPVERVRTDLSSMFSPQRIDFIIEEYTAGHVDIYEFYKELEENK